MKRIYLCAILGMYLLILFTVFLVIRWNKIMNLFNHKSYTIVIDAGHGGFDPGKIGINHALEKDINLSVAIKLKHLLEENDIHVIMTREEDKGLASKLDRNNKKQKTASPMPNNEKRKTASLMFNKKQVDMRKRISIINSSNASIAVSIHQNSFVEENSWGAQVFYYHNSGEGKLLAETIQERMKKTLGDGNHRLAKANSSYYLLKNSNCPLVIVECGFLSNWKEAALLCDDAYQDKLAWAIHLGIMEYLNQSESNSKTDAAGEKQLLPWLYNMFGKD